MKIFVPLLLFVNTAFAQVEIPRNPIVRPDGPPSRATGGIDPGATIDSGNAENPNVRYVTHIILHESRLWTSTEGKPLNAKLIAFEDLIAEAPKNSAPPNPPAPPVHPTTVRDGKVRLLVDRKPVELAVTRLSQPDRTLVEQIQATLAKKAKNAESTNAR